MLVKVDDLGLNFGFSKNADYLYIFSQTTPYPSLLSGKLFIPRIYDFNEIILIFLKDSNYYTSTYIRYPKEIMKMKRHFNGLQRWLQK